MRPIAVLALCAALASPASAQFSLGSTQNPPGLRWQEISSEHFRIVFPEELAADAQYCANLMEHVRGELSRGFDAAVPHTTIVLSNQQGVANGYVGFFPLRSEWFHVAPVQSLLGSNEWLSLLAVHEGRHIAQIREEDRGSVLAAYVLAGEVGQALMMLGLGAPTWFLEGDAVLSETLNSDGGRGRNPAFQRPLRTAALEHDLPSYREAIFGSYRRGFVNPYELGYYLTARIRRDWGPEAAGEVLRGAGRWAAIPGAFDRNLQRITGLSAPALYRSTLQELEALWKEQESGIPASPVRSLVRDPAAADRDRASYQFPSRVEGATIALKSSLSQAPVVVAIDDDGRERALHQARPAGGLTAGGGRAVWAQLFPDLRWGNRSTADLVSLDLATGALTRLTRGRILQAPAVAPDGVRIAVVEVLPDRVSRLVIFDADGRDAEAVRMPRGTHIQSPAWAPDGRRIFFYGISAEGRALCELSLDSGRVRDLLPPDNATLSGLAAWRDMVLLTADYCGPMAVYALDPSGRLWLVAARPYGVEGLSVSGDEVCFSQGTPGGLLPVLARLDPTRWTPQDSLPQRRVDYFGAVAQREGLGSIVAPADIPTRSYPVRAYRPDAGEILPYAWLPAVTVNGDGLQTAGLAIYSGNVLQDRLVVATAAWDVPRSGPDLSLQLEAGRWFPQLLLGASYQQRDYPDTDESAQSLLGSVGVRLPLTMDGVSASQGLLLETRYSAGPVWNRDREPLTVQALSASCSWFVASRLAARDLAPRWGLTLKGATGVELPIEGEPDAEAAWSAGADLFVPGLFRHHSIRLSPKIAFDRNGGLLPVPRGYASNPFEEDLVAGGSLSYRLPLAYPDVGSGTSVHVPRLIAGAFADAAAVPARIADSLKMTAGVELAAEVMVLVPLGVEVGVQLIYRFEDARWAVRDSLLGITVVIE